MKRNLRMGLVLFIASSTFAMGFSGCGESGRQQETSIENSVYENDDNDVADVTDDGDIAVADDNDEKKPDTEKLVNRMTDKEVGLAKKTEFQLLDKPWESVTDSDKDGGGSDKNSEGAGATEKREETEEDYSALKDKICYCEGIGAVVHGEPLFNALPPKDYTGGAGKIDFLHFNSKTSETIYETIEFDSFDDAKEKFRAEYDEIIAGGFPKVPADEDYNNLIMLYDAVISGDYEPIEQDYLDKYMDFYYGSFDETDSDSMYWEMDEEKVAEIQDHITEYHLYDEELDIGFTVHVITPPSYEESTAYPALVMTDAVWRFNDVTSLYGAMSEGKAKPQILITIGFEYDVDGWDNEVRGNILCNHKKEFLDFITDNMMPYLSGDYNFDYSNSTLFGHSQGGVFTHYAAFNYDRYENIPFENYIIGSPTFWTPYFTGVSDYEEYKNEYGYFDRNESYDRNLFITAGDMEDEDYEEYFGENDSTLEGVENLKERLRTHGVTTYEVKIYSSHHYQYVPEMLMEYITR